MILTSKLTANDDLQKNTIKDNKEAEIVKSIDDYDSNFLSYIAKLYESLNGEKINFDKIKNAVDALSLFNQKQEFCYLNNLMYPEKRKGVKIPSPIPVPSCAFQLHNSVTLTTNSHGYFAGVFNPFYLSNGSRLPHLFEDGEDLTMNITKTTSLWFNNNEFLNGSADNLHFSPVYIQQDIPNVYDQYRLVSASITLRYIGRLDIASGLIGGAIVFDESPCVGVIGTSGTGDAVESSNPMLAKYGNFDLAQDSFYWQENQAIEGLRELYFPIDNSFEEYVKLNDASTIKLVKQLISEDPRPQYAAICNMDQDYYKSGFNFMFYGWGLPPSAACFKLDIYCNFECLPNSSFLNYLPLSMNAMGVSSEEKRQASLIVQKQPVMKLNDEKSFSIVNYMPSIWERLKKKFHDSLPGISKLLNYKIVSSIPSLKPGIALANSMIASQAQVPESTVRPMDDVE
jgi:hypothetical protein